MGKIVQKVSLKNFINEGRAIEIDAIVDTGAAYMCLPPDIVKALNLKEAGMRRVKTANGIAERKIFSGCEININGRDTRMDIMENDISTPALIGYLVLEALDVLALVVDQPAPEEERVVDVAEVDESGVEDPRVAHGEHRTDDQARPLEQRRTRPLRRGLGRGVAHGPGSGNGPSMRAGNVNASAMFSKRSWRL